MAFPASLDTALTEAGQLAAALETVIVDLVAVADEKNLTSFSSMQESPDSNDVRVTVTLRSSGVSDVITQKLADLYGLTRGT